MIANIILPNKNQSFIRGQSINWHARYTSTLAGTTIHEWDETGIVRTDRPPLDQVTGPILLRSGYGTNASVGVRIEETTLGDRGNNNDVDGIIMDNATKDIPAALIKAVIKKESNFKPKAIRYEIHTDYNWYSKLDSTLPQEQGWRGLHGFPEKHWRLGGHNVPGETFINGDQVSDMSTSIFMRHREDAFPKLNIANTNSNPTAQEIVKANPNRDWTSLPPNLNYTAQLILASSYGLMQILYETARWNGFEDVSSPARPVEDLFIPSVNIKVGVHTLNFYYGVAENQHPAWSYEQKIKEALLQYNRDPQYAIDVYKIYLSGIYD